MEHFHFTQVLPLTQRRTKRLRLSRGSAALIQTMNRMTSAILAIPGDYHERLSTVSALSEGNALNSVQWDNPAQIRALLEQHPSLAATVAQAMRGLQFEFGPVPFRLRADEGYLVLAVQTSDEVGESIEKLEAFTQEFWKSRDESELLLALTLDFVAPSETPDE